MRHTSLLAPLGFSVSLLAILFAAVSMTSTSIASDTSHEAKTGHAIPAVEYSAPLNSALSLTITSDTNTEYLSTTTWLPAVLAWIHPEWPTLQDANWIWKSHLVTPDEARNGTAIITFRRRFRLPLGTQNVDGIIRITADDAYELSLNGTVIGQDGVLDPSGTDYSWRSIETYQFYPQPGENELVIRAINYRDTHGNNDPYSNPAGVLFRADVTYETPGFSLPFPHDPNENGLNRIYSFFDHEYPLLPTSIGGSEPQGSDIGNTILPFTGNRRQGTLYRCTGGYSCYSGHNGHDFSYNLPEGTPVLAAAAGEVTSGTDFCGSHYVKINHGRYQTVYWHLRNDAYWKRSGQVSAGERIGSVGNSGAPRCSSGPHLHFGIYYDYDGDGVFETDEIVDPYGFDPTKTDPWTLTFTDARGQQHQGAPNTWLWEFSPPAQAELTPDTGRRLATSNVDVSVPRNAVTNPTLAALMMAPEPNASSPSGASASLALSGATTDTIATGYTFQLSAAYTDGVPLTIFATPVTITVTYTDSDLTYVNETTLSLHQWEEASASWIPLTTALDISANQVMAITDEPGLFSLRAQPINPVPVLLAVFPSSTTNSAETRIVVTGTDFLPTPWLNFGIAALDVHYLSSSTLTATVPSLLAPGTYTLTLRNPDGQIAILPNSFTVRFSIYLPMIVKGH